MSFNRALEEERIRRMLRTHVPSSDYYGPAGAINALDALLARLDLLEKIAAAAARYTAAVVANTPTPPVTHQPHERAALAQERVEAGTELRLLLAQLDA